MLLDAVSETKPEPAEVAGESSLLSLVLLKRDGHWLIESARETGSSTSSPGGHLKVLEWMVGNWAKEASPQSGLSVRSTCDWTANQSFLIRKFKVEGRPDLMHAGTEVIGGTPWPTGSVPGCSIATAASARTYGSRTAIAGSSGTPAPGRMGAKSWPPTSSPSSRRYGISAVEGSHRQRPVAAQRPGDHHQAATAGEGRALCHGTGAAAAAARPPAAVEPRATITALFRSA